MGLISKHYFTFDGRRSTEWGVWISGGGTYNAPARDTEAIALPGVNGDFYLDNGRFLNTQVIYPAFISRDFSRIDEFRSWLASHYRMYYRLEDTYHPEEYRLATFVAGLTATPTARNIAGEFDITFDCKPQRYLKSGESPIEIGSGGKTLANPTDFEAYPLIRVYGSGTLTVGDINVSVDTDGTFTDINSEIQEAYEDEWIRNDCITLVDGDFPVLGAGETEISYTGFSRVEIRPGWWTI